MTALRMGFAQCDITPPLGLPLGGYAARLSPAEGVLDPLFCRVAFFDNGAAPLAVVVLDLVYVSASWVGRVRMRAAGRLGIRPERLLVAATHTHAGPGVFRSTIADTAALAAYEDELISTVTDCLLAAQGAAVPAELWFGRAPTRGVAANRRDPSLSVDECVRVLCARAPSGALSGVLANFACHSTVLSAANCSYSGDLFGAAAARAAGHLGAPVLLTNAAGGDVSTRFTRREQSRAEVQRLGTVLADAICAAVASAVPLPAVAGDGVGAAREVLEVRWRRLRSPGDAEAELQAAHSALHALRRGGADGGSLRLAESRLEGAQAELWVSSHGGWQALFGPRSASTEIQALHCGAVTLVAAPGELFSSAGEWLRNRLGALTLLVGYANDYLGYFIPEADARAGGYESLIAMVDPSCESDLRHALVALAHRAAPKLERHAER